ncbi:hypothetical protein [Ferruginibacter sp. HRS2-29]|uniref:hypothetical protein n=1 Tax=Ferruginibacter sp. HRS2-29 TaxID=2487334 RepID=UPI0020CBF3C5|nr:hypothetical protein [Ferruginibacter sp. HRS2-29]MCP9749583.1 hypothetical protein [Ferruginibacter sp. HRS2-29]
MRLLSLVFVCFSLFACNSGSQKKNATAPPNDFKITDTLKGHTVSGNPDSMPPVPAAELIVPGKSIGLTSIGERADSVNAKLGRPDDGDAAMGKAISTWYSKGNKLHSTTIFFSVNFGDKDEASRAKQIRITSPYFKTQEGLCVGSHMEEISKVYPVLKKTGRYPSPTNATQMVVVMDEPDKGIAFEISPAYKCVGIVIHRPEDKPFETYLGFIKGYTPSAP